MLRFLSVFIVLIMSQTAVASKIAVVDFQRAVTETTEGKQAQAQLDSMYESKKKAIENMQTEIQQAYQDYQGQKAILSNDAKQAAEQKLMVQQQRFEQTYMQYQNEMQQSYMQMLQGLDKKMRAMTYTIGKEKGYSLVLDKAVVVYAGHDTIDITDVLINRYNAK